MLGATTNASINVLQLLLKLYSFVHFWIPRFTCSKNHWDGSWSGSSNEINPNGWSTFKCSLHYKELQNPIPYLGNGMILTSHFVCFWELFFLLWYFFLFCCSSKAWIGLLTSSINVCMQLIFFPSWNLNAKILLYLTDYQVNEQMNLTYFLYDFHLKN